MTDFGNSTFYCVCGSTSFSACGRVEVLYNDSARHEYILFKRFRSMLKLCSCGCCIFAAMACRQILKLLLKIQLNIILNGETLQLKAIIFARYLALNNEVQPFDVRLKRF